MFDHFEKPTYDFQVHFNCIRAVYEFDSSIIVSQYVVHDSYQNLDAYLGHRRSILRKLNVDDFSDKKVYKRAWLLGRTIIHACMYPDTRTADIAFFIIKGEVFVHLDMKDVVLKYRKHLADKA